MASFVDSKNLIAAMNKEIKKAKDAKVEVIVGYTAEYAIHVHERLDLTHKPGKQAKYLEQPARELNNSGRLADVIVKVYQQTGSMGLGLDAGGLLIQRESQKVVPVDTSNLKGSAFTRRD